MIPIPMRAMDATTTNPTPGETSIAESTRSSLPINPNVHGFGVGLIAGHIIAIGGLDVFQF